MHQIILSVIGRLFIGGRHMRLLLVLGTYLLASCASQYGLVNPQPAGVVVPPIYSEFLLKIDDAVHNNSSIGEASGCAALEVKNLRDSLQNGFRNSFKTYNPTGKSKGELRLTRVEVIHLPAKNGRIGCELNVKYSASLNVDGRTTKGASGLVQPLVTQTGYRSSELQSALERMFEEISQKIF